jgi:SHS2 domain-containing protein
MHEVFEHTADIGLRARAETLDQLLVEMAGALFSVIVTNLDAVEPVQECAFEVEGSRHDDLLFDWLSELLYVFDTKHLLFSKFSVKLTGSRFEATARGEPMDQERHVMGMEVKAITYHGLKVEREGDGWLAEVIVDI